MERWEQFPGVCAVPLVCARWAVYLGQRGTVRDVRGVAPGLCDRVAALIKFETPVLLESLKVLALHCHTSWRPPAKPARQTANSSGGCTKSVRSQGLLIFKFYFRSLFSLPDFGRVSTCRESNRSGLRTCDSLPRSVGSFFYARRLLACL